MNDPLKNFIDHNRDDFDNLEPSPGILLKIKGELKSENPEEKKTIIKLVFNQKWLVAASVIIVLFSGYLIFNNNNGGVIIKEDQTVAHEKVKSRIEANHEDKSIRTEANRLSVVKSVVTKHKVEAIIKQEKKIIDMTGIYKNLADSSSSSTRLAAILKIEDSGIINYDMMDRLAKTLDVDENSSVKLAALSLLGQYSEDSYVSNIFLKALKTQKDPIVQLGLIELLSKTDNPKLDDRLYELANAPNTLAAVKDQAYLVLLNQHKL